MKPIEISKQEHIFENKYLRLYSVEARFNGFKKQYFVTEYGKRVGLLVLKGDHVLLVRQYRLLIDRVSCEVPGGKVEEGETFEAAAIKECFEETGVRCRTVKPLFNYFPGTDCVNNPTELFYSTDFEEVGDIEDKNEIESFVWMPFSECMEMIFSAKIVDGLTIMSLFSYQILHGAPKS